MRRCQWAWASEVAALRKEVDSVIRSLNEQKEGEARRDQAIGFRRQSGSPDGMVYIGAGDIFSILNRSSAIAQISSF
jgi:hypothetical protein